MPTTWAQRWQEPGGHGEVLRLAWPLILSNTFWGVQAALDRVLISWQDTDAVGAVLATIMLFWTALQLPHSTASYVTNFVAQYRGANRPDRIGVVVWQAIHFSIVVGCAFVLLIPVGAWIIELGGHDARVRELETTYFSILCFAALPLLVQAAVIGFFTGLGHTRVVVVLYAAGLVTNLVVAWLLIFGHHGLPQLGVAGAGWALVAGSWVSALLGVGLMLRRVHREQHGTLSGWRFDPHLCGRLLRFGIPSGVQWTLDALAWTLFVWFVARLGPAEQAATSIAFTLNLLAYMPTMGIAQAGAVLVGQRLGENRPDLAERSVWSTCRLAWWLMAVLGTALVLFPGLFLAPFQPLEGAVISETTAPWETVAGLVPVLLWFVAAYCLFDSLNLVFAFALKGAGDVTFVTIASLVLAWLTMVMPTWLVVDFGGGLYAAWSCATTYVIALALLFLWRFRQGHWKSMRLIETTVIETPAGGSEPPREPAPEPARL